MTEAHIEIAERRSLKMIELNSGDVMIFIYCIDNKDVHHELVNFTVPQNRRDIIAQYLHV